MSEESVFERFRRVAAEILAVEPERVTPGACFGDDLDADSLDVVELVMGVEREFDITVDETELDDVTVVQQVLDLIQQKLDEKG